MFATSLLFTAAILSVHPDDARETVRSLGDTIRVEVGASEVDGRVYRPHAARVRVWVGGGPGEGRMRAQWTNVIALRASPP